MKSILKELRYNHGDEIEFVGYKVGNAKIIERYLQERKYLICFSDGSEGWHKADRIERITELYKPGKEPEKISQVRGVFW